MTHSNAGNGDNPKKRRLWHLLEAWAGPIIAVLVLLALAGCFTWLIRSGRMDTGFDPYTAPNPLTERGKTFWDWLDLILVPLVLALGAGMFTWVTNKRERDAAERRTQADREAQQRQFEQAQRIEEDRLHEAAFQAYLDRMTELIKEGLCASAANDPKRSIAVARTVTALRQLDSQRNRLLLSFLRDSNLIGGSSIVLLAATDLSGANLCKAPLRETDLRFVDLRGAKLDGAILRNANLQGATLNGAHLANADLCEADLREARLLDVEMDGALLNRADLRSANMVRANLQLVLLRDANLSDADLRKANLSLADLGGADLTGTNLEGASLAMAKVLDEQLRKAYSLEGATMPDGTKHP